MEKYYLYWASGSLAQIKEFDKLADMLECVRQHYEMFEWLPVVYYGEKLEFEPAEIIKSWKVKL